MVLSHLLLSDLALCPSLQADSGARDNLSAILPRGGFAASLTSQHFEDDPKVG